MVFLLNILSPLMDDPLFVRRLQGVRDLFREKVSAWRTPQNGATQLYRATSLPRTIVP
jgi:hypothetical protein